LKSAFCFTIVFFITISSVFACTRVLFTGADNTVVTGRSMDWREDMYSNLWVMPRGVKRDGAAGANSVTWTAKYGSVIVSGYEAGSADGMNEQGLVANMLYLAESNYGQPDPAKQKLSIAAWAQYVLDNFATVAETVAALSQEKFQIIAPVLPDGSPAQLHLSVSDPTGDSAVFEYVDGKLVIHHGKQYQVMTNSPTYDQQLALDAYWKSIGGITFLPGTSRAADRFARASFLLRSIPQQINTSYIRAVPEHSFDHQAIASVMGIMRNVSVPIGVAMPNEPNIASTLWRTIADQKNKVYYYDSATSPNTFWVALSDLNFKEGAPVMKLQLTDGAIYSGNVSKLFKKAEPFKFLPAK
jgi:choloylglycine hydrolase